MIKEFIISLCLLFSFSSCGEGLFGWDSSGGAEPVRGDIGIDVTEFLVNIPMNYPYSGGGVLTETSYGPSILVQGVILEIEDSLETLTGGEALAVVQFVCDQTAVSLNSLSIDSEKLVINWNNNSMDTLELSISNSAFENSGLRVIECL